MPASIATRARTYFNEMLIFLDMVADSKQFISPPEAVDVAWHAFILHTRDYEDYCRERYGHVIHHQPTGEPDPHAYKLAYDRRAQAGPVDNSVWIAPAAGGAIVGGAAAEAGAGGVSNVGGAVQDAGPGDGGGGGFFSSLFGGGSSDSGSSDSGGSPGDFGGGSSGDSGGGGSSCGGGSGCGGGGGGG